MPAPPHPVLMVQEEELIQSENSASIFNTLSDIPSQIADAELLLGEAMRLAGSLTDVAVETQRRKHLAYLIADQGQLLGTGTTTNLSQVRGGRLALPCCAAFPDPRGPHDAPALLRVMHPAALSLAWFGQGTDCPGLSDSELITGLSDEPVPVKG